MLFDTPVFFLFLCLTVLCYWCLKFRAQNKFLLVASYFFYGWWDWRFLCLMIASTLIDYFIAIKIADTEDQRVAAVTANPVAGDQFFDSGIFQVFQLLRRFSAYFALDAGRFRSRLPLLRIILPPGISFYTFQEVAYIVDVYAGRVPASRSFFDYGLFISLFPHLIAGPIQRPSHLLPQVQKPRQWDSDKAFDGMLLILEGLFRKCVIADNCALIANAAFGGAFGRPSLPVVTARNLRVRLADLRRLQRLQRHCARQRAAARIPLHGEFPPALFRRQHSGFLAALAHQSQHLAAGLSVHSAGRQSQRRTPNLSQSAATMLLGGLWHGANWTFVVWGALHGGWSRHRAEINPGPSHLAG